MLGSTTKATPIAGNSRGSWGPSHSFLRSPWPQGPRTSPLWVPLAMGYEKSPASLEYPCRHSVQDHGDLVVHLLPKRLPTSMYPHHFYSSRRRQVVRWLSRSNAGPRGLQVRQHCSFPHTGCVQRSKEDHRKARVSFVEAEGDRPQKLCCGLPQRRWAKVTSSAPATGSPCLPRR